MKTNGKNWKGKVSGQCLWFMNVGQQVTPCSISIILHWPQKIWMPSFSIKQLLLQLLLFIWINRTLLSTQISELCTNFPILFLLLNLKPKIPFVFTYQMNIALFGLNNTHESVWKTKNKISHLSFNWTEFLDFYPALSHKLGRLQQLVAQ